MSSLVRAEVLKLRTTRTALGFLTATVVLSLALLTLQLAFSDFPTQDDVRSVLSGASVLAALLLVFGIVGTTGEYRHGTITGSLLVAPVRSRLVASKLIAYAASGLLLGAAAMVVTFVVGIPWLDAKEGAASLGKSDLVKLFAGGIFVAGVYGAIGVGVGTIVRGQAPAVITALVYLFVLEPTILAISEPIAAFTVSGASSGVLGLEYDWTLSPFPAALVLLAWVGVLSAIGIVLEQRRDVL
jgi:hypothetical protein